MKRRRWSGETNSWGLFSLRTFSNSLKKERQTDYIDTTDKTVPHYTVIFYLSSK